MKKIVVLLFAAVVCLSSAPASANTIISNGLFGQAAGFNIFAFGDYTGSGGSVEGSVAVGGNFEALGGYQIATEIANGSLYVGGDVTYLGGGQVGGGLGQGTVFFTGDLTSTGGQQATFSLTDPLPIDFAATLDVVKANSAFWAGLPTTGNANIVDQDLFVTVGSGLNVINIPAELIVPADFISITGPAGATVLINVIGEGEATFTDGEVLLQGGVGAGSVLFNLPGATSLTLSDVDVLGSIIAPMADLALFDTSVDGQVIVNDFTGTAPHEVDLPLFAGELAPIPVPAAVWLLGAGLAGLVIRRRG